MQAGALRQRLIVYILYFLLELIKSKSILYYLLKVKKVGGLFVIFISTVYVRHLPNLFLLKKCHIIWQIS